MYICEAENYFGNTVYLENKDSDFNYYFIDGSLIEHVIERYTKVIDHHPLRLFGIKDVCHHRLSLYKNCHHVGMKILINIRLAVLTSHSYFNQCQPLFIQNKEENQIIDRTLQNRVECTKFSLDV